jgi:FtsP/CotA-like multicopper oxidase with cupredoxin domain
MAGRMARVGAILVRAMISRATPLLCTQYGSKLCAMRCNTSIGVASSSCQRPRRACLAGAVAIVCALSALAGAADSSAQSDHSAIAVARSNDNTHPAGRFAGNVLTLRLELRTGRWYPEDDDGENTVLNTFAEEGQAPQIPGPLVRVTEDTEVTASVKNTLAKIVYVHGLHAHPGVDKDVLEIPPGSTPEVRFRSGAAGTYYYWASTRPGPIFTRATQDTLLSGAFVVDRKGAPTNDRVFVVNMWYTSEKPDFSDLKQIATINGKSWPYTEHFTFHVSEPVLWRFINTSLFDHAMHLHGFYFRVNGISDGEHSTTYDAAHTPEVVTQHFNPGETFDMTWIPDRVGRWVMHCHMTIHMVPQDRLPEVKPAAVRHTGTAESADMGGLILGINILPKPGVETPASSPFAPARKLQLLVRERPASEHSLAGLSYDQPENGKETPVEQLPRVGRPLVLTRGEPTEITVVNHLRQPTTIHWHGIEIESYYDGVSGWTGTPSRVTPPIAPGESFVVHITPRAPVPSSITHTGTTLRRLRRDLPGH